MGATLRMDDMVELAGLRVCCSSCCCFRAVSSKATVDSEGRLLKRSARLTRDGNESSGSVDATRMTAIGRMSAIAKANLDE